MKFVPSCAFCSLEGFVYEMLSIQSIVLSISSVLESVKLSCLSHIAYKILPELRLPPFGTGGSDMGHERQLPSYQKP
jgi:hypothetical protein